MLDPRKEEQECQTPGLSNLEEVLGQVGNVEAKACLPAFSPPFCVT